MKPFPASKIRGDLAVFVGAAWDVVALQDPDSGDAGRDRQGDERRRRSFGSLCSRASDPFARSAIGGERERILAKVVIAVNIGRCAGCD